MANPDVRFDFLVLSHITFSMTIAVLKPALFLLARHILPGTFSCPSSMSLRAKSG